MASCVKEGIFYVGQDPQLGQIRGLDPWAVDNGIHLISMQPDKTEGIMMITDQNQQQYGTVHGGMLVAFADTIAGHSLTPHGKMCVTQGSTVNFLRPAAGAYLFCRATPVKVGKRICVVSVEQWNDKDEMVTTALFTFAVVEDIEPILVEPKYPDLTF
ncbi:MAG: PaaI family thioesterase [Bacillota bacterium]|nr:PaaI family thioesterase [Bacillota bacterium]